MVNGQSRMAEPTVDSQPPIRVKVRDIGIHKVKPFHSIQVSFLQETRINEKEAGIEVYDANDALTFMGAMETIGKKGR